MIWTITLTPQQAQVLNSLRRASSAGVLNAALQKLSLRYGARTHELEKKGWTIEVKKAHGKGLYRYTLTREPHIPGLTLKVISPIPLVPPTGLFADRQIVTEGPEWLNSPSQSLSSKPPEK